jgi:hypothetical protein
MKGNKGRFLREIPPEGYMPEGIAEVASFLATYNSDSPEDLLDSLWNRFCRIVSFGCRQTDDFGTSKGKGGRYQNTAEAFKARIERAWVTVVFASNIPAVLATGTVDYDS